MYFGASAQCLLFYFLGVTLKPISSQYSLLLVQYRFLTANRSMFILCTSTEGILPNIVCSTTIDILNTTRITRAVSDRRYDCLLLWHIAQKTAGCESLAVCVRVTRAPHARPLSLAAVIHAMHVCVVCAFAAKRLLKRAHRFEIQRWQLRRRRHRKLPFKCSIRANSAMVIYFDSCNCEYRYK